MQHRGRHVVAVPNERHRPTLQTAPEFHERLDVRERLAGMLFVGQCIDHVQARCGAADLLETILAERSNDDGVDPTLEVAGHIVNRLAIGVHHVGRDLDHVASQLANPDRERHTRPQGGLLEQEADMPTVEGVRGRSAQAHRALAFEPRREVQRQAQLLVVEVEHREKVLAANSRHVGVECPHGSAHFQCPVANVQLPVASGQWPVVSGQSVSSC